MKISHVSNPQATTTKAAEICHCHPKPAIDIRSALQPLIPPLSQAIAQAIVSILRPTVPAPTAPTSGMPGPQVKADDIARYLQPNAQGEVHEEMLYHSLVANLLEQGSGKEVSESYRRTVDTILEGSTRKSYESASKKALDDLVSSGKLTREERKTVQTQAFAAAQLDSNPEALYDDKGGGNDKTIATRELRSAAELAARQLQSPKQPRSTSASQLQGFLWKPAAEKDGKLVILLPQNLTGKVASVELWHKDQRIASGKYSGLGNGDREHFRFSKAGKSYPDGLTVVIRLQDGNSVTIPIPDTAKRTERK